MTASAEQKINRTAVVVLGMHRSGTSALTRVIALLGGALPKTLVAKSKNDNALGFWESRRLVDLSKDIDVSAGSSWNDWTRLSEAWLTSPMKAAFLEQAQQALAEEFGDAPFFVIKDPRICRMMPFWREALEAFGAQVVVVSPLRHPFEVAASMEKRNKMLPVEGQLSWLRHVLEAEYASRDLPRVYTRYDELLGNWRGTLTRVGQGLDLSWPNWTPDAEAKIDDFLSPDERHHAIPDARLQEDPQLSVWIKDSFAILNRWQEGKEQKEDHRRLDEIREAFNQATPAFEAAVTAAREKTALSLQLQQTLEQAEQKLGKAEQTQVQQHEQIGVLSRDLELAQTKNRDLETAQECLKTQADRLAETQSALAQRRAEAEETTAQLSALQEDHAEQAQQLSQAVAQVEVLRRELVQVSMVLSKAQLRSTGLASEVTQLGAELAQEQSRSAGVLKQLDHVQDQAQARAQTHAQEISVLTHTLKQIQGRTEALDTACDRLRQRDSETRILMEAMLQGHRSGGRILRKLRARHLLPRTRLERSLLRSGVFDAQWYRSYYDDVAASGTDPVQHFIEFGMAEGRLPNATFNEVDP